MPTKSLNDFLPHTYGLRPSITADNGAITQLQWSEDSMRYFVIMMVAFFATIAGPALAGPREDTLSGISRCSALVDDRSFLDCVYGAAQPMRARLGLPPAPLSQIQLVPGGAPKSGRPVPHGDATVATPAMSAPKRGGWLSALLDNDGTPVLNMVSYTFDGHGKFTVTLSNGEVWRQKQNDTNYATWRGLASRYVVRVIESASQDVKMDVKGEGGPYAVERVR